jgi:hypothetical protein
MLSSNCVQCLPMTLGILQVLTSVIILLMPIFFSRDMSRIQKGSWVILGLITLLLGCLQVRQEYVERKAAASVGTLEAPPAIEEHPNTLPLRIGKSCVTFLLKIPPGSMTTELLPLPIGDKWDDQPIYLSVRDGYMFVNTTLRDEEGNVVAVLRDNEWQVNENNYFDRNYSSNALEVLDNKDRVVLQIITTESEILLSVLLTGPDGQTLTTVGSEGEGAIFKNATKNNPADLEIPRYFKYPSDTHLGELSA